MLDAVYSDPRQPGSFSGVDKLRRAVKSSKNYDVSVRNVKEWLRGKDTYTKHRTARKIFHRNRIVSPYIDAQWQGDLAEVGNLASDNDGIRYLLVVIDVVSKYLWVEPLKTKKGIEVRDALKKIFHRSGRKPDKLQTDQGKEFLDKNVQSFLKKEGIEFFTVKSDKKAAIAERVIRTLKEKLYRYMHEKHTNEYVDALQDLVISYNNTYHKSIKRTPAEVTVENEGEVLETLYGDAWKVDRIDSRKKQRSPIKVDDFVRISRVKGVFAKGYTGNWTEEIFVVTKVES